VRERAQPVVARFEFDDDALLGSRGVARGDRGEGVAVGRDGVFDRDFAADFERFDELGEAGDVDGAAVDRGNEIAAPDGRRGIAIAGERAGADGGADRAVR